MLRLSFVTGTEPGKWFTRYRQGTDHGLREIGHDDPFALLEQGECNLALMRLPDARVDDRHHVVVLYDEAPGVAVPKESLYALSAEQLTAADLDGEIENFRWVEGASTSDLRDALRVVAANVGVAFAPKPLLKVLAKKQVTVRGVEGDPTQIALVWRRDEDSDAIQDFVGVAKGRTPRSSRSSPRTGGRRGRR
ncbi:LysR family transcriptional regulator substrate-binding protein [Corynebacterium lipophiloflavum]|uniref:LysR substrate-binding domain-containing protein n=1 Tax=Corynebacterium lipophiloflavum (strain ATCC 700352 / DSM 44291 / CCUG 37336 / JCM 10383 / DMMZ 1944) TaxID=525263 RepID=C0XPX6_CORLD|nr:LysR family transcriptional regulator substrate-binding protein [Corynebacterium lipophiloflavum]EEI17707.1 hypothetical protein HMPREF0298_0496 [Corynebacterium lipophiloflavum DSM 44291]